MIAIDLPGELCPYDVDNLGIALENIECHVDIEAIIQLAQLCFKNKQLKYMKNIYICILNGIVFFKLLQEHQTTGILSALILKKIKD